MAPVDGDAPSERSLADRLSAPLAAVDADVNDVHDRLNALVPWLWRPLSPPGVEDRLDARHHALYAAHAGVGVVAAALLVPGPRRRGALVGLAVVAAVGWVVFTGAWDRRADGTQAR
jgi:hypothetical protein